MTQRVHSPELQSEDQRLSQLIQIKRAEQPDAAFWTRFEHELKAKQLSTVVQPHSLIKRSWIAGRITAKKLTLPAAACGALALTHFTATGGLASNPAPNDQAPSTAASFVVADEELRELPLSASQLDSLQAQSVSDTHRKNR